jgi:hypothetical protein
MYFRVVQGCNITSDNALLLLKLGTEFGLKQINPEETSNHFGLEASLLQPERDLSKNVTK